MKNILFKIRSLWFIIRHGAWSIQFSSEYENPFIEFDEDEWYEYDYVSIHEYSLKVWLIYICIRMKY